MAAAKAKKRKKREGQRYSAQAAQDVSLARWDQGAAGPANRRGLVTEDRGDIDPETGKAVNPNGVKGARRMDMLEYWHRRGTITTAGFNAGEKLRNAYEATQRGKSWPESERVQSSSKPDQAVAIHIDRVSDYHAYAKLVHRDDQRIIDACVLSPHTPAAAGYKREAYQDGLRHLRDALERLAKRMGS